MLQQFQYAYLRQTFLQGKLQQADEQGQGGMAALAYFVAKSQVDLSAALAERQTGHKNGKNRHTAPVFVRELEEELDRLHRHALSFLEGLWIRLTDLVEQLRSATALARNAAGRGTPMGSDRPAQLDALKEQCDLLGQDLVAIDTFVRQNAHAAACLALRFDAGHLALPADEFPIGTWSSSYVHEQQQIYAVCMRQCILGTSPTANMGALLVGLSDIYAWETGLEKDTWPAAARWVPPARFQRETTKFWLQPDNIMRFKAEMIKHVPILIFNERPGLTAGSTQSAEEMVQAMRDQPRKPLTDWCAVSSVYFDDAELQAYLSRLQRDDEASVIRVRWYGSRSTSSAQELFVERKVHREPWTGERSHKERYPIQQGQIAALSCEERIVDAAADPKPTAFFNDVKTALIEDEQGPVLRTVCNRTAFQETSTNDIRVSLDCDVFMTREAEHQRSNGNWCRDDRTAVQPEDLVTFPLAIVEVKLQTEAAPDWLQILVASGMLVYAPRFSKYLHGCAALNPNGVASMPYWFLENDDGTYAAATFSEMADTGEEQDKTADWLFPQKSNHFVPKRLADMLPQPQPVVSSTTSSLPMPELAPPAVSRPDSLPHSDSVVNSVADVHALCLSDGADTSESTHTSQQQSGITFSTRPSGSRDSEADLDAAQAHVSCHTIAQSPDAPAQQLKEQEEARAVLITVEPASDGPAAPPQAASTQMHWWQLPFAAMTAKRTSDDAAELSKSAFGLPSYRAKALVRTRVEPKTFFANERTFLQWLQISVLIMFMGLSLLGGSSISGPSLGSSGCSPDDSACGAGRYAGLIIAPVAILFMGYSLLMYRKRTTQILRSRSRRYDDQRGPVLLVFLLIAATITALVLAAKAAHL